MLKIFTRPFAKHRCSHRKASLARSTAFLLSLAVFSTFQAGCQPEEGASSGSESTKTESAPSQTSVVKETQSASTPPPINDAMYADIPLTIASVNETSYDGGMTVGIRFSAPLSSNQPFQNYVHISGETPAWILSDDGLTLYLADPEPERT